MNPEPIKNEALLRLKESIDFKKNYLIMLHKRISLIKTGYSAKSEYEKNEIDISVFETHAMVNKVSQSIEKKEIEYRLAAIKFYAELEEMNRNYTNVIEEAKQKQSTNIDIKHLLYHANWKYLDENIEEKLKFYHNLKQYLYGSGNEE